MMTDLRKIYTAEQRGSPWRVSDCFHWAAIYIDIYTEAYHRSLRAVVYV